MLSRMDKAKEKLISLASKSLNEQPQVKPSKKKIIHSRKASSLRDTFKKTFLPLLIDISELRLKLENYKLQKTSGHIFRAEEMEQSPEEILEKLELLQEDICETRRWCEGVISQIERGIDETHELLEFLGRGQEEETNWKSWFKKK